MTNGLSWSLGNRSPLLFERLRLAPAPHSVPGSLPVLFFGDPSRVRIATVAINPSYREYSHPIRQGSDSLEELDGPGTRRFQTLRSLGARSREQLSDDQCDRAIAMMRGYFGSTGSAYGVWFNHLERVLNGMGCGFANGTSAHLDLVQEATWPKWAELAKGFPTEADELWKRDARFFCRLVEVLPVEVLVCNGKSVLVSTEKLIGATRVADGALARVQWVVSKGAIAGRPIWVAGWNLPLVRATGLGRDGEHELGRTLRATLRDAGMATD